MEVPGWGCRYEHGSPARPEFIDCNSLQKTTKHWLCTKYDVGKAASPVRPARPDHTQDSVLELHYSMRIQEKPDMIVSWNSFMCPACQSAKSHKLWMESIKKIFWSNVMQLLKVAILILCFLSERPKYRVWAQGLGSERRNWDFPSCFPTLLMSHLSVH